MESDQKLVLDTCLKEYEIVQANLRSLNNQSIASLAALLAVVLTGLNFNSDLMYIFLPFVTFGIGLLGIYLRTILVGHFQYLNYLERKINSTSKGNKDSTDRHSDKYNDSKLLEFEHVVRPQLDRATLRFWGAGTWFYVFFLIFLLSATGFSTFRGYNYILERYRTLAIFYLIFTIFMALIFLGTITYSTVKSQRFITSRLSDNTVRSFFDE